MKKEDTYIGQKVRPITDSGKNKVLYVLENHSDDVAGVSSSPNTDPERSYGVLYSVLEPIED